MSDGYPVYLEGCITVIDKGNKFKVNCLMFSVYPVYDFEKALIRLTFSVGVDLPNKTRCYETKRLTKELKSSSYASFI